MVDSQNLVKYNIFQEGKKVNLSSFHIDKFVDWKARVSITFLLCNLKAKAFMSIVIYKATNYVYFSFIKRSQDLK